MILENVNDKKIVDLDHVEVRGIELETRQELMERLLKVVDEDNGHFLHRLRNRIDRFDQKLIMLFFTERRSKII